MKTLIELGCQAFVIGMVLTVVPLTIHAVITDHRNGDSWKTILNRYL